MLMNVFVVEVVCNTRDMIPMILDVDWEAVDGSKFYTKDQSYLVLPSGARGRVCVCFTIGGSPDGQYGREMGPIYTLHR